MSIEILIAFFAASIVLAVAPGPDNIFVLTQSALYGRKAGFVTSLGLCTGICLHTALVALGVAMLIKANPLALSVIRALGAAYLLYLAYLSFRSGSTRAVMENKAFIGYGKLYARGIIMNITNPKVLLFFLAFLPQFVQGTTRTGLQIMVLGFLFICATLIVFGTVSFLGGTIAKWFNATAKGQIILNRVAGCVFLGLAVLLIFSNMKLF